MLFLLLALALPANAARKPHLPEADALLRKAAAVPPPHEGVLLAGARRVRVAFLPPGKWRREVLGENGETSLLYVSNGRTQWLYDAKRRRAWTGEASDPDYKQLGREDETDLIAENYEMSVSTGEPVAGRSTWLLTLRSKTDGKAERRYWLDRRGGLVLRSETPFSRSRFESVAYGRPKAEAFRFSPPEGVAVSRRSERDYLGLDQAKAASGLEPRPPKWLPGGYVFESVDVLERGGRNLLHARFSDGVNVLSLFQCPPRVKLDFGGQKRETVRLSAGAAELAETPEGRVLAWESRGERFVLVGRLSPEALKKVADSVP